MSSERGIGFWDWILGPHPKIRIACMVLACLIVLYVSIQYVHYIVAVSFILAVIVSYYLFKGMIFDSDGVRALQFYEDRPRVVDILFIGADTFEEMPKIGGTLPMGTSYGQPIHVIENIDDDGIVHFAWIEEASQIDFISKKQSFTLLSDLAEESLLAYERIKNIPISLGISAAGKITNVIKEDVAHSIFTLDPVSPQWREELRHLKEMESPLEKVRNRIKEAAERLAEEQTQEVPLDEFSDTE